MVDSSGANLDDSDHDGISDALEQRLLVQFAPHFLIASNDCSHAPAQMLPNSDVPQVKAENGAIYGQVFPSKAASRAGIPTAEIHYYHLWRNDCGAHGHPLDVEHVSVLVQASGSAGAATWKAVYWFAAAHQNTVCDVSQITRAVTVAAEEHGAQVWISAGKHASFLNEALCYGGCGNDSCENMKPLPIDRIVNLGEPGHPMNGSRWIGSSMWPLSIKMSTSDFPPAPLARLNELPVTDIAWFNAGRHPAQGVIAISSYTADSTGNAVQKIYKCMKNALVVSITRIGQCLRLKQNGNSPETAVKRTVRPGYSGGGQVAF